MSAPTAAPAPQAGAAAAVEQAVQQVVQQVRLGRACRLCTTPHPTQSCPASCHLPCPTIALTPPADCRFAPAYTPLLPPANPSPSLQATSDQQKAELHACPCHRSFNSTLTRLPPTTPPSLQAMSDQQKAELKGRLKDVMSRLMQRDQSAAAMHELHVLRK